MLGDDRKIARKYPMAQPLVVSDGTVRPDSLLSHKIGKSYALRHERGEKRKAQEMANDRLPFAKFYFANERTLDEDGKRRNKELLRALANKSHDEFELLIERVRVDVIT